MHTQRIESLDSVRGLAAMAVVIYHCLISFNLFYEADSNHIYKNWLIEVLSVSPANILWAGKEAVILFFVLSGFVLAIPFIDNRITSYKEFAVKRLFRIYVPYILLMIISTILVILCAEYKETGNLSYIYEIRWDHDVSLLAVISYFLMLPHDIKNVNGVVWSLFHEMRISLFFPLIMLIVIKYNWKKSLILSFGILVLIKSTLEVFSIVVVNDIISSIFSNFGDTFYYSLFFVLGAILSKYRYAVIANFKSKPVYIKLLLFVVSLFLINNKWMLYFTRSEYLLLREMIWGIGFVILLAVVLGSTSAQKLLTVKPLLWLGKVSYSLYLTHIPVLMLLTIFLGKIIPIEIAFILVPFISLPVAYVAYKYVELPAIKWGRQTISFIRNKKQPSNSDIRSV